MEKVNDIARNVILSVDNSSSSLTDNPKNNFLVLSEGQTEGINGSVGTAEKKYSINFSKANTNFYLSLHYNGDESYLYVNKINYKFKVKSNISWYNFCIGSLSKDFTKDEQNEISWNDTVYDFSGDHSSIKKEDILNIHQYLLIKNDIKNVYFY